MNDTDNIYFYRYIVYQSLEIVANSLTKYLRKSKYILILDLINNLQFCATEDASALNNFCCMCTV